MASINNAFYFPHDMDAISDAKLQEILREKGLEGIGAFWCILERMYRNGGVLTETEISALAWSLHLKPNSTLLDEVIGNYGLFVIENGEIRSERVSQNLKNRADISSRRKAASALGVASRRPNGLPNGLPNDEPRKGKEIKEINKENFDDARPSLQELMKGTKYEL